MADAVLQLEYDPSINQTAESFHMMKVRNNSRQRQCWMAVSKKWCELDIDSDNLDLHTDKHDDWNLVLAHHEEGRGGVYPLTLTEIADAQRKDQELKAYLKAKRPSAGYGNAFEGHASDECPLPNLLQPIIENDSCQPRALVECMILDHLDKEGDHDAFEGRVSNECLLTILHQPIIENHSPQPHAIFECQVSDQLDDGGFHNAYEGRAS